MTTRAPQAPALADIHAAAKLLAPYIVRTPLLEFDTGGPTRKIFLKLENLQSTGVFKVRPIGNILLQTGQETMTGRCYTASSGNAGLALAWIAARLELNATVYAPESAPQDKLAAIRNIGSHVELMPDTEWWQIVESGHHPDDPGLYVDAVRHPLALAGSGTIGVEIVEQISDADTVIMPFGGGGLCCGIAAAIRALKPDMRIIIAESDAAAPLTAAMQAGRPVPVEVQSSFISGAGAPTVLPEMWPLINELIDDSIVVPVGAVADAIRRLFTHGKVIAEGAGAIAVAGALSGGRDFRRTVCIVSGGNIDPGLVAAILRDQD